jgi:cardiolipin synthase A/B
MYIILLLIAAVGFLVSGCATLPNVSTVIDESTTAKPRQLLSSQGLLSPKKSAAVMERLKGSVDPTDILARHTAVVESVTESPLTKGNKVILLADGQDTYAAMFKEIGKAKDHIHLETFIIEDDATGHRFADLLLYKQAEGVQVNLIYDSVGSMNTPDAFFQRLRDGGIQVVEFNPINPLRAWGKWALTHRDHRKILLVDGKVAIIGGINISKVYSSNPLKRKHNAMTPIHWRDTDVQIEGPAAAEFQKLFLDTWLTQTKTPLTGENYFPVLQHEGNALVRVVGSTPGQSNRGPFVAYVSAFVFAEHSIYMTNSYFIPDPQIVEALTTAAERGVDVKIILPGISDSKLALHAQRHYYSRLLRSGVKIYEHGTSLLHAKTAVVDKVWSTVGSTNMDQLSMLHNDEVNAFILSREFAAEMEEMFLMDLVQSSQIHLDEWQNRSLYPKFRSWFVQLFSRWL